jgi:hypothetical protein
MSMKPGVMLAGPDVPGNGLLAMVDSLVQGTSALSKAEVATFQQAVDTFASSYTSGSDASKDQAALGALSSSLDNLFTSHWATVAGGALGSAPGGSGSGGGVAVPANVMTTTAVPMARMLTTTTTGGSSSGTTVTPTGQPTGMG